MLATKIDKPDKVDLSKIPTDSKGGMDKEEGQARFAEFAEQLHDLQELLYAANQNALLVVLQGRDTSGKDGTLKAVAGAMNPVGVRIASFKVPTPEEQAHDFLWRIHKETPALGQAVFFNRSHYEDVLATRVHDLVPKKVWERRFDDINRFEELLHHSGVIVVKFYLHISKAEQEERLQAREATPEKAWKLSAGDWEERKFWGAYTEAYEDALGKCASSHAPWYVVPADHKWYRNLAIAEAVVDALKPHKNEWVKRLEQVGAEKHAALEKARAEGEIEETKQAQV
jgi:PPK2 family polyphosphate:nucleotide phosphotransferase